MASYIIHIALAVSLYYNSCMARSIWSYDVVEAQNAINAHIFNIEADTPAVGTVTDQVLTTTGGTVPIRLYSPSSGEHLPIIVLIHGGAWVGGSLDSHDNLARYLCQTTEALVLSVGYTNSPEAKFPEALEQCYDAFRWISENAHTYKADASRIAIVGDSSGGNMATALCMMARDRKGPNILLQVLINPAPDLTCKGTLSPQHDAVDFLRWQALHYVKDPQDVYHPYVSPLHASDLRQLPPALVILAEKDSLRADGQKYAERLIAAEVPTNIYIQWGVDHLAGNGARASLMAQEALDVTAAALKGAFRRTP